MDSNNEPNIDKDHNARAKVWRELLLIYGLLAAALVLNWLAPPFKDWFA